MKTSSVTALLVGSLALALGGCGSTVDGGGGGEGGEGGGPPNVCASFEDPDSGAPRATTVRFVNDTDDPIYLGDPLESCGGYDPFSLERDGISVKPRLGICAFTCATVMRGGCNCPAVCENPASFLITPGGSLELTWDGMDYEPATLPSECFDADACQSSCFLPRFAQGVYQVTGEAFGAFACLSGDDCDCDPDDSGSCQLQDYGHPSGAPRAVTVSYDYNASALVELVFD